MFEFTRSSKSRASWIFVFTLVFVGSTTFAVAAPPLAPRIENAYAEASNKATVIFYGKVPVVGDLPTTFTAISTPDSKSGSITQLGEGGRGVITVEGLKASTSYTFVVQAKNSDGTSQSFESNSVTTLAAGLVSTFGPITSTSTGFTTQVSNFNASFTYSIKSSRGNASIAPYDGSIVVENIGNPGELATITVTTSRTGYDSASSTLSAKSRSSTEPSKLTVKTSPTITRSGNQIECATGVYEFLRNGKYPEVPNLASATFILEIANINQSIFSSDDFLVSPRFLFPEFTNRINGSGTLQSVKWDISSLAVKSPLRCLIFATQEGASISASTPIISDVVKTSSRPLRKVINCKKGTVLRKVTGTDPKCPRGYVLVP